MANLDWSQCPAVESIAGKVSGAWVLRGTRMPVAAIFENIEAGANIDDIMEWFDGATPSMLTSVYRFRIPTVRRGGCGAHRPASVAPESGRLHGRHAACGAVS
jgi:uncharacterized protein (DUF433 family)